MLLASYCQAANDVAGEMILFNDNGAWSWFEDERAIVDIIAGKIVVSTVANGSGPGGAARNGDVEVAALDMASSAVSQFTLSNSLQADDHNSAALWQRPDGRYLALYAKHGSDVLTRFRISSPGDISSWTPQQTFNNGAGTTYSNLYYLPNDNAGAGRLYNFTRTVGFDPNILVSSDFGSSWSYGGRLLAEGTSSDRPYLRYAADGNRVHLIATNRHPRNFDNSVYHAYIEDGQLYSSTGALLDGNLFDAAAVAPSNLTPIFNTGTVFDGVTMRRGWTIDVAIDNAGQPYALFQARANGSDLDHRFFYGRFNGTNWDVHQLAKAGGYLYSPENDYTGLGALDPSDPNRLFVSTRIDPRDDASLPHYEIFEGRTNDGGSNWTWSPITANSTVDNLRPIIPQWDTENTALLWLRGSYTTYTNYNLKAVGLTEFDTLTKTAVGDFDRDGSIDLEDFTVFLSGLHSDLAGLNPEDAYEFGDLNGDLQNNYHDFALFREIYDAANGAGAFAAALNHVPEVSALALVMLGAPAILFVNVRSSRDSHHRRGRNRT